MIFNIHSLQWDEELSRLFRIPVAMLPKVGGSSERYAEVTTTLGLGGIAIAGIAGDQQSSLFGQRCFAPGLTKNTYGTGCFLLQNIGTKPIKSSNRMVTTVAWKVGNSIEYALEGSVFVGGAVVQWLRDGLGLIQSSSDIEALAASVPDNGGVYFVPAFVGLGAPHWDQYARGSIFGLTRGTSSGHIARAALESIAYQVADLLHATQRDSGTNLRELRVDGGAAANGMLMQFQADVLGMPVVRPESTESTALGAAYLAGLSTGIWHDIHEIAALPLKEQRFEPRMNPSVGERLRERWNEAVLRSRGWAKG
jgi:glycerol kinase